MHSLTAYIQRHSIEQPHRLALVSQGQEWTYAELYTAILERAEELRSEGIQPGEPCELPPATQDHRFVISYLAMLHLGAMPLLYTTGTTGKPRSILFTPEAWMADADNLIHAQGFQRDLLFITTGPLNHFGNLSKLYPTFIVGAALYVMQGMKSLDDFYEALDYQHTKGHANQPTSDLVSQSTNGLVSHINQPDSDLISQSANGLVSHASQPANDLVSQPTDIIGSQPIPLKRACFLVPASIRMLIQLSRDRLSQHRDVIDFIETGAAPISQADMQTLAELLPHSRLYNTYASTETGIACTYQFNDGHQYASCVGPHLRNTEVFITDQDGNRYTADADHPGHITCQGATVMGGYYQTNDLGYINAEGLLFLTGRASDLINVGGLKVSPIEIEDVALTLPEIKECICIPQPHPIMGQVPRLLVVMADGYTFDRRAIGLFLKSRLESYKVPLSYEQVDHIARTFNGKPNRKAYL